MTRFLSGFAALLFAGFLGLGDASAGIAGDVRKESFRLLNEGVTAYNNGDYHVAVDRLERCAAVSLNSFRAHYYLGLARNAARRYAAAVEALEIALDLEPTHLMSLVALGDAWLKLGDLDESRAAYFRALKIRPALAAALDGLARTYEGQAETDRALDYYRQAILSDKGFAPAYTHLGDLYLRENRMRDAILLLEEAVKIRPDFAGGLNRLAVAYGRLGLSNQAVAAVQKAIELEPTNPDHPATLGELQLASGRITAAEESFARAVEIDPELPAGRLGRAEISRRRGHYPAALEALDALAASRSPAIEEVRERIDELRTRWSAERDALARLEARIADGTATAEEHAALATLAAGRGEWGLAATQQSDAPGTPAAQERLAYFLFRSGRYRESQAIYARLAADTGDAELLLNEGVTLARLGDDERAVASFRRVLERDPENLRARVYLGNALLRLGATTQAAESYRQFLVDGGGGETAEQLRRILEQIAPEMIPGPRREALPLPPPPSADNPVENS